MSGSWPPGPDGTVIAAKIARREPRRFSRVMLVEGGHTGWKATARRYFKGGGEALVLGCGGWRCAQRARRACKLVARAARRKKRCVAIYARGVGHSYTEPLPARVKPSFDALLLEPLLRHGAAP